MFDGAPALASPASLVFALQVDVRLTALVLLLEEAAFFALLLNGHWLATVLKIIR
jgi:hypothetical protein